MALSSSPKIVRLRENGRAMPERVIVTEPAIEPRRFQSYQRCRGCP